MKAITNIFISLAAFFIAISIAGATEIDQVLKVVILAFIINGLLLYQLIHFKQKSFMI
jgi:hypothetical protein